MALLKGIERCEYISKVIDDIDFLIWVKDKDDNLIFANKPAFDFFRKLNRENVLICPIKMEECEKDKEIKLNIEGNNLWIRFSSMPIHNEKVLVIADDITDQKENETRVSEILDKKILEWKIEREERFKRLDRNNQEMFEMLNLMKNSGQECLYNE
ncbi:hypothetical protein KKF82_06400 [Patescibacteria group bacterium]|nr:hypothetical protein [Patescibacteria group bacterium]